jgi:PRTRC genetic system protein E
MTPTTSTASGLFSQLAPLLAYRAVLITVSKLEDELLQVNICPRQLKEGENHALTTPLCVTGTAVELDAELVPQISSFVESHVGLATNLAAIEKEPRRNTRSSATAEGKRRRLVLLSHQRQRNRNKRRHLKRGACLMH